MRPRFCLGLDARSGRTDIESRGQLHRLATGPLVLEDVDELVREHVSGRGGLGIVGAGRECYMSAMCEGACLDRAGLLAGGPGRMDPDTREIRAEQPRELRRDALR